MKIDLVEWRQLSGLEEAADQERLMRGLRAGDPSAADALFRQLSRAGDTIGLKRLGLSSDWMWRVSYANEKDRSPYARDWLKPIVAQVARGMIRRGGIQSVGSKDPTLVVHGVGRTADMAMALDGAAIKERLAAIERGTGDEFTLHGPLWRPPGYIKLLR
jgi:hypothetical protein